MEPGKLPRVELIGVDGGVAAFTLAVSLLSALAVGLVPGLRASRRSLGPALVSGAREIGESAGRPRLRGALVVVEIALAVVLVRTRELGVRIALGASRSDVVRLVLGHGLALTLIGIAIGLFGALAVSRVLSSLLFEVSATDSASFAATAVILSAVALVACYVPARRAASVDPTEALRAE